jgi:hypothetical protein
MGERNLVDAQKLRFFGEFYAFGGVIAGDPWRHGARRRRLSRAPAAGIAAAGNS